ncbi:hypothetical protein [Brevibacterium sp. H602]|uniref:hypothetical protein n=1 Tax=Brevibacterium sp. H602 TaxID=3444316 RepID=UPI003EB9BD63
MLAVSIANVDLRLESRNRVFDEPHRADRLSDALAACIDILQYLDDPPCACANRMRFAEGTHLVDGHDRAAHRCVEHRDREREWTIPSNVDQRLQDRRHRDPIDELVPCTI